MSHRWETNESDVLMYRAAATLGAGSPGWLVIYGCGSRRLWAFGAADGRPVCGRDAGELLAGMLAAGFERRTA